MNKSSIELFFCLFFDQTIEETKDMDFLQCAVQGYLYIIAEILNDSFHYIHSHCRRLFFVVEKKDMRIFRMPG